MKKALITLPIALCIVLLAAFPVTAGAHAMLDHAAPKVGSVVSKSPDAIQIWFSTDVDASKCIITVQDAHQKQVDKKDTYGDKKDKTLVSVSVPVLPDGDYTVQWKAVSLNDGHHTHGTFKFTVKVTP